MTDKPTIAAMLATGRIDYETPTGWRAADLGLRGEVIEAALRIRPPQELHRALRTGKPIRFRDDEKNITVRWSPG